MSDDFLTELETLLQQNQRQYGEYDSEILRALKVIQKFLDRYDFDGTITFAEDRAREALDTLFDHIHCAELADRFLNQPKTRQGTIDELTEEL